jgi:hypothetical protein
MSNLITYLEHLKHYHRDPPKSVDQSEYFNFMFSIKHAILVGRSLVNDVGLLPKIIIYNNLIRYLNDILFFYEESKTLQDAERAENIAHFRYQITCSLADSKLEYFKLSEHTVK